MFPALANYKSQPETKSCFLDGRYIPIVLKEVKEFHKQPIHLHATFDKNLELISANNHGSVFIREGMNIVRAIIITPSVSHSALIWVDTRDKTVIFTDVRDSEIADKYMRALDNVISKLMKDFFGHLGFTHSTDIAYAPRVTAENCEMFGYCNAYVIKQVIDYLAGRDFDSSEIKRFAGAIERKYSYLLDPNTEPEVEYFIGGLGLGLLGGVAIGSAVASRPVYYAAPAYGYPAPAYGYPAQYGYPARYY